MGKALRDSFGEALVEAGKENKDIVALDCDLSGSTRTKHFKAAYPDRFFNMGISEGGMVATACGLAKEGKIPFANTFATFLITNGLLPIRTYASYSKMNVKLVGHYGGLSDAYDGPTHHCLEDIAIMRSMANIQVLVASDDAQVHWMVDYAVNHQGPVYLRMSRAETPKLYPKDEKFDLGKAKTLREGKDVSFIACGLMVAKCLEAADILAEKGIEARVIDMFSIKPIDEETILKAAQETQLIVTAEEHNVVGGLGGAVAEVLSAHGSNRDQVFIGLQDTHAETGAYDALFDKYGLSPEKIADRVLEKMN